jgi:hypothetical protein
MRESHRVHYCADSYAVVMNVILCLFCEGDGVSSLFPPSDARVFVESEKVELWG